jgi:putative membrane protein
MSVTLLPPLPAEDRTARLFRWLLYGFVGTMVFSLAGSLLLRWVPAVVPFFGPYYPSLVKAPTWVYMGLLPVLPVLMYTRSLGPWLMAFFVGWGCLVGGMSELIGTQTGFPFGKYGYSEWLGPKLMGHVPYFIPFSWFAMSILSLDLASRLTVRRYERVLVAALFMVLWDVSLDPAMSRAFPFWSYPEGGFYFGMPALNWLGWFVVSGVIVWGFEVIGGGLPVPHPQAPLVYLLNGLFPLLLCLVYDLYAAFFIGSLATALPLLAVRGRPALHHPE